MAEVAEQPVPMERDFLRLEGTDYVEFWVGNARQAAYYYRAAFGMKLVAYSGPETGSRETVSYVLEQGKARFVLTTALRPEHAIAEHVRRHGDGVRDIALAVAGAEAAYREATARGARSVSPPALLEDCNGCVKKAAIAVYGDTIHSFVERKGYRGAFMPGFEALEGPDPVSRPVGLTHID
ncbi:MAG: 4-hydroxyphenylpyruvate dioxygenase, partial [Candidatus Rokuibacteriota bacterium]